MKKKLPVILAAVVLLLSLCACEYIDFGESGGTSAVTLDDIPAYSGEPYVILNDNWPEFDEGDYTTDAFEYYSELDYLGRCGVAYASICPELMPTEERGAIGQVKPSGWHTVTYDFVDGRYLYNRCHLIGYQLAGENANEKNLITGTRYMNVTGMLPFENMVAYYVDETGNHVLYRVTPIYDGSDLVAQGVQMEAFSVEDDGEGVCFNVFVYNVQPGVVIDYATGNSWAEGTETESGGEEEQTYVLNTSTHRFHNPDCSSVTDMKPENRQDYTGSREDLLAAGYTPCGSCKP